MTDTPPMETPGPDEAAAPAVVAAGARCASAWDAAAGTLTR
jgi:hypothetical protein